MSGEMGATAYELLLELWRLEKASPGLIKLPDGLEERLREYFSKMRGYLKVSDKRSLTAGIREAELEAAAKLAESLFKLRLEKIMRAASRGEVPENLHGFEKGVYASLQRIIQEQRERVRNIITAAYRGWRPIESEYELVCFLQDFPQIVGEDLRSYGPFKRGDIAALPRGNARTLMMRGVARKLSVSGPEVEE